MGASKECEKPSTYRHLGVLHRPLKRLLLRLARSLLLLKLVAFAHLALDLAGVLALFIGVSRLGARLDRPRVVAHAREDERLADVGLDEGRVERDGRVGVLERLGEGGQLGVGG